MKFEEMKVGDVIEVVRTTTGKITLVDPEDGSVQIDTNYGGDRADREWVFFTRSRFFKQDISLISRAREALVAGTILRIRANDVIVVINKSGGYTVVAKPRGNAYPIGMCTTTTIYRDDDGAYEILWEPEEDDDHLALEGKI